jgi:3-methylfumaryl-CoA hydratase
MVLTEEAAKHMSEPRSIDELQHGVVRRETCSLATVRRVAAMLDEDPDQWSEGDPLPRGWQFILLGADTRRSAIREDGFAGLGVPLPDLGLPRLMLGGRTVRFECDIRIGATVRRESKIQKLSQKEARDGPRAIVTVEHALYAEETSRPVLTETQTYIMLSARPGASKVNDPGNVASLATMKRIVPDETLLFHYSALGFNSHRIHLDRDFARQAEGFPDLVVNGGLVTLLLTELLRNELGGALTSLAANHVAPLFCGRPIFLGSDRQDDKWLLRAFDDSGRLAVEIQADASTESRT